MKRRTLRGNGAVVVERVVEAVERKLRKGDAVKVCRLGVVLRLDCLSVSKVCIFMTAR